MLTKKQKSILKHMSEEREEYMKLPKEFDECIKGVVETFQGSVLVYDEDMVIKALMKNNKWTEEEAWEWFGYNILGAYMGETTPVYWVEIEEE